MTTVQKTLLKALYCLLLIFILLATISFTFDLAYRSSTVPFLTACRVALIFAGSGFLWVDRARLVESLDLISASLIAIIVLGTFTGLFAHGDWFGYLRHGFQYCFMLVFYLLGRNLARYPIPAAAMNIVCISILFGYAIATVFYSETRGLQTGSYSYQPNLALLPLALNSSAIMSVTSFLTMLIGNKRAVLLGTCFCLAALIVLSITRHKGVPRFPYSSAAILGLSPIILVCITMTLSLITKTSAWLDSSSSSPPSSNSSGSPSSAPSKPNAPPLIGMIGNRFSAEPSFVDTSGAKRSDAELKRLEAGIDPMLRLTGARNVEAESVWHLIKDAPLGILLGAGFGSQFEVNYISPNNYEPVRFMRDQADVMPTHIALTSGLPLAMIFSFGVLASLGRLFLRLEKLSGVDRALAIFSVSLTVDILLGFNGTNPMIWGPIGYITMRVLGAGAMAPSVYPLASQGAAAE